MCSVRLGQKYYRVGGGWCWGQKIRGTYSGKIVEYLNTDFTEERCGSGGKVMNDVLEPGIVRISGWKNAIVPSDIFLQTFATPIGYIER